MKIMKRFYHKYLGKSMIQYSVQILGNTVTATMKTTPDKRRGQINFGESTSFTIPEESTLDVKILRENWNNGVPTYGHPALDRWHQPEGGIERDQAEELLAQAKALEKVEDEDEKIMLCFIDIKNAYPLGRIDRSMELEKAKKTPEKPK